MIDERFRERLGLSKKAQLDDVLWNFGVGDDEQIGTAQLFDDRTIFIIKNYLFYKNNPSKAFDSQIWFESVVQLNQIFSQSLCI